MFEQNRATLCQRPASITGTRQSCGSLPFSAPCRGLTGTCPGAVIVTGRMNWISPDRGIAAIESAVVTGITPPAVADAELPSRPLPSLPSLPEPCQGLRRRDTGQTVPACFPLRAGRGRARTSARPSECHSVREMRIRYDRGMVRRPQGRSGDQMLRVVRACSPGPKHPFVALRTSAESR